MFAQSHDMPEHADLFARAALAARDPDRFGNMTQLGEDEQNTLAYEAAHKWHGPFSAYHIRSAMMRPLTDSFKCSGTRSRYVPLAQPHKGYVTWTRQLHRSAACDSASSTDVLSHVVGSNGIQRRKVRVSRTCLDVKLIWMALTSRIIACPGRKTLVLQ